MLVPRQRLTGNGRFVHGRSPANDLRIHSDHIGWLEDQNVAEFDVVKGGVGNLPVTALDRRRFWSPIDESLEGRLTGGDPKLLQRLA